MRNELQKAYSILEMGFGKKPKVNGEELKLNTLQLSVSQFEDVAKILLLGLKIEMRRSGKGLLIIVNI